MQLFLKAKHWQLFCAFFLIPVLIPVVAVPLLVSSRDPFLFISFMIPASLGVSLFSALLMFGWLRAMVMGLKHRVPADVRINYRTFNWFWGFPLAYLTIGIGLIFWLFTSGRFPFFPPPGPDTLFAIFPLMLVHLFAVFCIFYCMYIAAKTIKAVELQRNVAFGDFIGEFVLIWFQFIGVWFIQPKLNKWSDKTGNNDPLDLV